MFRSSGTYKDGTGSGEVTEVVPGACIHSAPDGMTAQEWHEKWLWDHKNNKKVDRNVIRKTVKCDDDCGAFEYPYSFEEYVAAWEHWRGHSSLSGCSHQR